PTGERAAAELGCDRIETSFDGASSPERSTLRTIRTVNDVFLSILERGQGSVMMHRQAIDWISISSQELYRNVVGVARAVESWSIVKGDRVAILSENRPEWRDRKSTRLNSSHQILSYAVFCLKKKK